VAAQRSASISIAVAFLLTRAAFVTAYISNRATLRTMLWNAAMAFNLGIFFLAGFGMPGAIVASLIGLAFALGTGALLAMRG
jgi:hypothetical protein